MVKKTVSQISSQNFPIIGLKDRFPSDIGEAVSSIILISELSVYMQNSSAFDALCNGPTPESCAIGISPLRIFENVYPLCIHWLDWKS